MAEAGDRRLTDDEVKHLELVQGVVARMGQNSFTVKTGAVGLIAATFALAAEKDVRPGFVLIAPHTTLQGQHSRYCIADATSAHPYPEPDPLRTRPWRT